MEDLWLETTGCHLLVEFWGCDSQPLNDLSYLEHHLRLAAERANTTVVGACFHRFSPTGVSGVVVISESHLSIHTWPEKGYAAVDFYTCGDGDPWIAYEVIREALSSQSTQVISVRRGIGKDTTCSVEQFAWSSEHVHAQALPVGSGSRLGSSGS